MKLKVLSGICLSLCVLPIVTTAGEGAGGKEGHGGVSIVCRSPNHSIKSVELLDTFEGNNQYNLKIGGSALPLEDQLEQAQTRLASRPDLLDEFQSELANVQAHIQFLKQGVGLNPTDDAFPVITKKGCRYEQLAVYTHGGQVLVDSELYGALSLTDQAALYVHEVIFKMARGRGATSSVESRKLTAYLFTRPNQPSVTKELLASMFPPPAPPVSDTPATEKYSAFYDMPTGWFTAPPGQYMCDIHVVRESATEPGYSKITLSWGGNGCAAAGSRAENYRAACDKHSCSLVSDSGGWVHLYPRGANSLFYSYEDGRQVLYKR